jgi:hypothetical protein
MNVELTFEQLRYSLKSFRTKNTYIFFLISQLALAFLIIPIALGSPAHFRSPYVLFLEFLLFLLLAFDLYLWP